MITALWRCKSVGFTDQKRLFYLAKEPLLQSKTIGFVMH